MSETFKFLHGSDFRLDRSMRDFAPIPAHLRGVVADSPYLAATRFFDLAISESVDFVLLAGNLFETELGSCRPATFLLNQFNRLRDKGIPVYWCGGQTDHPDRWPAGVELPDNVTCYPTTAVEESTVRRRGKPVATILGTGHDSRRTSTSDFAVEASAPFPVALCCGSMDASVSLARNIRYWALGGSAQPSFAERSGAVVVRPGSPQSRSSAETGAHGCYLVRVDAQGICRPQFVELDAVRWLPQSLSVAENATDEDLQNLLGERALKLLSDHPDRLLLVSWHLDTAGTFQPSFRTEAHIESLLKWLRDEFGRAVEGLWSTGLRIAPPERLPEGWHEEDTILGDFLRAVGRYQGDESLNLALHEWLPESVDSADVTGVVRLTGDARASVLSDATLLGVGYLGAGRDAAEAMNTK